ncbi:hypothetical protein D5766_25105 [Salmonella enterica subsp. enterica serovar Enteritidis]|nr:hypothetical protein [Salmonella enterica subsp. enterica serovar Enteritidis]
MGVLATAIDQQLFEQSQTHQGVQADFRGKKNLICFLLNKGSRSLASLTPKTQKPKTKGQGRGVKCPRTQLQELALPPLNKPTHRNGRRPAARG